MPIDHNRNDPDTLADPASAADPIRDKLIDAWTPGFQVEFDPDEAERAGAFIEDALSEADAAASVDDLIEIDGALEELPRDDEGSSPDRAQPAS